MSADMSPYCSVHDAWLIMKLCMFVEYHDANNVSNFGGDPVTQLNYKKTLTFFYAVLQLRRTIAVMRPLVLRLLLRDHAQTAAVWKTIADNTIKRPYQPKHSPSSDRQRHPTCASSPCVATNVGVSRWIHPAMFRGGRLLAS